MKLFSSNNIYYKTSLINAIVTICLFVVATVFFFFNLKEIPLGILLGGSVSSIIYVFFGLLEGRKISKTIVFIVIKSILFILFVLGLAILYYKLDIKIFNPFAFMAMYLLPTVLFVFISRKENNNA